MTRAAARDALTVNVASLLTEPGGSVRDYVFEDLNLDLGEELTLARPAAAKFRLTRTNRGLLVDGAVRATLAETCSRCLQPIEIEVVQDIDEEALPSVDLASGAPLDHSDEPEVARLTKHHEVELGTFVREAILLAEPIAPLCRPDCPGLCPECGEELSSGPHDHGEAAIDPRLEALRAFRVDAGDESA